MSDDLQFTLSQEAQAALDHIPGMPLAVATRVARAFDFQNELTVGYAKVNKLSARSATTLGVVTNRLRSALARTPARIQGDRIVSSIGDSVVYAARHEYGFDGTETVRAHRRRIRSRDVVGKVGSRQRLTAQGVGFVREFTRRAHTPARSFVGSSLRERKPDYDAAISQAVLDGFAGKGGAE